MKPRSNELPAAAAEEAALWAARLDGDPLAGDRCAELDAWLARDPRHRALLSRYCQFSADLEKHLPELVAAGAIAAPPAAPPARRFGWGRSLFGFGLAAAAVAAVTVWFTRPARNPAEDIVTATAQRATHVLADGTRIELNARTRLRFAQVGNERRVRLEGGEALFAVTRDPARPFVVTTSTGTVHVTGTTFSVRDDPAAPVALEVVVVEGSVRVRPRHASDESFALKAGDRLAASQKQVSVGPLSPAALENALAWRDGFAVFDDLPLAEAAACFARYHGRKIVVAPEVARQRLGGLYRLDDLGAFTAGLERTNLPQPVSVRTSPDGALHVLPRPAR